MKKIFVFTFLLVSIIALACKCEGFGDIGVQYHNAQFVGEITILKVYPSKKKGRTYFAEIRTDKIYKGSPVKVLEIAGVLGDVRSAACETALSAGEKYIVYLSNKDSENIISLTTRGGNKYSSSKNYLLTACTPRTLVNGTNNKKLETEVAVLNYLSSHSDNLEFVSFLDDSVQNDGGNYFKNLKLTQPKQFFALYKLKVDDKSKVTAINVIQNFGSAEDEKIVAYIKKNCTIIKGFFQEVRNEEVVLMLFYITENAKHEFLPTITNVLQ